MDVRLLTSELVLALAHPLPLAVLGLCIGSFLNVVVHRLPLMLERQWWSATAWQLHDADSHARTLGTFPSPALVATAGALQQALGALPVLSLSRPRSRCPACGTPIAWHDNIPLLGWIKRRGRCAACGSGISARYPLLELATAVLFAVLGMRFEAHGSALMWCAVAAVLLALALIDWDTLRLPDALTLPLLWAGLVAAALGWTAPGPQALADALWGAVLGYGLLRTLGGLYTLVTGREGLRHGDFKLMAALGAWLGPWMIVPTLLLASASRVAAGRAVKPVAHRHEDGRLPFGVVMAGAGLAVMLAGPANVLGWTDLDTAWKTLAPSWAAG
jgi:leader peptidase (prepilin peptidase)/N-methyltransferase